MPGQDAKPAERAHYRPIFHDGSQATLWDVVDHYDHGNGVKDPWLDEDIQPLALSESEINDLADSLTGLAGPQYEQLGPRDWRVSERYLA